MDYLSNAQTVATVQQEREQQTDTEKDDRGLFDHVIDMVEGYDQLTTIANDITDAMQRDVTKPLEVATEEFDRLTAGGRMADPRAAQAVARRLANNIAKFNVNLAKANVEYVEILRNTEHSLEFVASFAVTQDEQTDTCLDEQFNHLLDLRTSAMGRSRLMHHFGKVLR